MITIEKVILKKVKLKLKTPFKTAHSSTHYREILLLQVRDHSGISVWSECVAQHNPSYSPETIETATHILEKYILPKTYQHTFAHPNEISPFLNQDIRGHFMAKAAVEMAGWAIAATKANQSLATYIGGTQKKIETGIAFGLQDSPDVLVERVGKAISEGYKKAKLKISPGKDYHYIKAAVDKYGDKIKLMADANSAYTLKDIALLKRLDTLNLLMIEQPLAWDDIIDHATLQKELKTPICLDESILHFQSARQAVDSGATQIINIKPGRVGGFAEAIKIHDYCLKNNIPVWCGGMLESGVGRAYNVALASLPGFTLPGDLSPSSRYWEQDIVTPEWVMDEEGMMVVPFDQVGIGVEVNKL